MFDWLKQRLVPKRIDDSVFGSLRYMPGKGPIGGYWEGGGTFPPLRLEIEYTVDADQDGPGEPQHAFWRDLCARYPEIVRDIEQALAPAYSSWFRRAPASPISDVFTLEGLSIPRAFGDNVAWDLTYHCHDNEHMFTVPMRGWRPDGEVSIDG